MKTWLEYINEQAVAVGMEVKEDGIYRPQGPYTVEWESGGAYLVSRAEVEAFILGVVFGRTGKLEA